ncbi:YlmC/YmxH family sporulation protein [Bacillus solimangrovi]|uniref:PRC-barrel domain-containing protein n=1 Tax=Bacillus solimangrovi TaxID=1305675 RepID=A0A1E5LB03_9BACI|nr:YlmC/YmxH family sporulation protein [Bacillus solimangrovi]OEH91179.1 hypothetical protein BFG57_06065 [Bacillus solimangrovi]
MIRISEFQSKDVVNVSNGKRLGHIIDFDIDLDSGKINTVSVPLKGKSMRFLGRDDAMTISWENIVKIGQDVILVRVNDVNIIE